MNLVQLNIAIGYLAALMGAIFAVNTLRAPAKAFRLSQAMTILMVSALLALKSYLSDSQVMQSLTVFPFQWPAFLHSHFFEALTTVGILGFMITVYLSYTQQTGRLLKKDLYILVLIILMGCLSAGILFLSGVAIISPEQFVLASLAMIACALLFTLTVRTLEEKRDSNIQSLYETELRAQIAAKMKNTLNKIPTPKPGPALVFDAAMVSDDRRPEVTDQIPSQDSLSRRDQTLS